MRVDMSWGTKLRGLVVVSWGRLVLGGLGMGAYNWYSQMLDSKVSAPLFCKEQDRPLVSMLEHVNGSWMVYKLVRFGG